MAALALTHPPFPSLKRAPQVHSWWRALVSWTASGVAGPSLIWSVRPAFLGSLVPRFFGQIAASELPPHGAYGLTMYRCVSAPFAHELSTDAIGVRDLSLRPTLLNGKSFPVNCSILLFESGTPHT